MAPRFWIVLGALSAAAAVGLGAYHAHGLERMLATRGLDAPELQRKMHDVDVAVRYQLAHALALLLVGLFGVHARSSAFQVAGILFVIGTILFCAGIDLSVLAEIKLPWFIIPLGGLSFIGGWVAVAVAAIRSRL